MDNDNPGTPRPVRCRSRGRGRRATDRGSFRPAGRCRNARTPLLPEPEMAQDALDDILLVDERNDAHFPCRESFHGDLQPVGIPHLLINSRRAWRCNALVSRDVYKGLTVLATTPAISALTTLDSVHPDTVDLLSLSEIFLPLSAITSLLPHLGSHCGLHVFLRLRRPPGARRKSTGPAGRSTGAAGGSTGAGRLGE